jgi:DNA replication and repair protein RecF
MILTSLKLKNFRCHQDISLSFSENLNYIVGGNGQGKTAILESIYYLCTTKSHNTNSDSEVLKFGEDVFEISGNFKNLVNDEVRIFYSSEEKKKNYLQNGKHKHRLSEVIGNYPIVLLTPADHSITFGYPVDRRKFIDSIYCQASRAYLHLLVDYNKTVRQRTSLLNSIKESRSKNLSEFDAWTQKLLETGLELISYRKKFFSEFEPFLQQAHKEILNGNENPGITYYYLGGYDGENLRDKFIELLNAKRDDELRRCACLVGPHKDDFIFDFNGINLKIFGSQGQHKTFQVALRFAEFFYLKEKTGKAPIFLLDDVFGELDTARSVRISENLRRVGQTFITLTDFTNISYLHKQNTDTVIKLMNGNAIYA